ncbi:hypothetical protein [Streptomyces sp. NPDC050504]|uniref:hypothetical protein n=1 Tax=Streptomyces sp. NPDC050504 TaxID=3365618 RepID=UPI00378B226C
MPHRTPDTGHRTPDTGHRTPDTGHRVGEKAEAPGRPGPESRPVFGLGPEWLLHDGEPLATATVLSHPEQFERLRAACPEAAGTAVLAGDPCFDRMLAAQGRRAGFRRGFGVEDGRRLVVLNSTWGPHSLFGSAELPWLLEELTGTLPVDEYRICAVLHPNIWYGHGPGQVRRWLDRARRSGVVLVPPLDGWRQALIAADLVIGDHGSVTFYAAALGRPVLLGAFPEGELDPASPVAELGRIAPRLRLGRPLRRQIERTIKGYAPGRYDGVGAQTTSAPLESAGLLRRVFHGISGAPEPARPAALERLDDVRGFDRAVEVPLRVLTSVLGPGEVEVTRYADPLHEPALPEADDAHTAVPEKCRDEGRLALADVVLLHGVEGEGARAARARAHEVLRRCPNAALSACVLGSETRAVATLRDGTAVELAARPAGSEPAGSTEVGSNGGFDDPCDPGAYASALYAWLSSGKTLEELGGLLRVRTGRTVHHVDVAVIPPEARPDAP